MFNRNVPAPPPAQQGAVPVEERLDRIEACLRAIQAVLLGLPPGLPARDGQGLLRAEDQWLLPEVIQADQAPGQLPPGVSWVGALRVGYRLGNPRWLVDTEQGILVGVAEVADYTSAAVWVYAPLNTTIGILQGPTPDVNSMFKFTVAATTKSPQVYVVAVLAPYLAVDVRGLAGNIRVAVVGLPVLTVTP